MYDAFLQLLYLIHEPGDAAKRALAYLEFGVVEQYAFMEIMVNSTNAFARRIAASSLRSSAEPHIRSEFKRVKDQYCGKNGKPRSHWYKGTLRDIANEVGRAEEYSWYVNMLSSSVHAGAFAATRGPLPVNGDAFVIWAAMIASQAADVLVRFSGIKITRRSKRIIADNGEDLLQKKPSGRA